MKPRHNKFIINPNSTVKKYSHIYSLFNMRGGKYRGLVIKAYTNLLIEKRFFSFRKF
jgi:hypothetical protein